MTTPNTLVPVKTAMKPIAEMSREERLAFWRKYSSQNTSSKLTVKGEDGIHYLWAPKDDESELIRLDGLGYIIVKVDPKASSETRKVKAAGMKQDGTFSIGDVILMQCPEELYQLHLLDVEMRAEQLRDGAISDFRIEQEKRGVPTFETSGRR